MTVRVRAGLSGTAPADVSSSTVSVSIVRGRQDETEPFQAGRASLVMRNVSGEFDPAGTAVFRLRDEIEVAWLGNGTAVPVFTGFVEDVTLDYDLSGDAIVNVACVDGLALLANQTLVNAAVSEETSGARVDVVLANAGVSWPAGTAIDAGISVLAAGTATGNALTYLRQAEQSEQGYLYVDREGTLTFRNRRTALNNPIPGEQFSDDGNGIPYQQIARFSGARSLFNRVIGSLEDGTVRTADNPVSQSEFSIRTLDVGELLLESEITLGELTDYLLARYAEPDTRVESLTVNLSRLSASDAQKVVAFDLVDQCDVEFRPPGRSPLISSVLVQGVRHDVTVGAAWRTSFTFEERDIRAFFVLDDAVFGRLNVNVLAF